MSKQRRSDQTKSPEAAATTETAEAPLALFVEPDARRGTTRSLYRQLHDAITTGRVRNGDRLPPTRELAKQLGVSRQTVTTVYGQLAAEGYIGGNTRAGTFVHATRAPRRASATKPDDSTIKAVLASDVRFDLRPGTPDASLFPTAVWRRCLSSSVQSVLASYSDPAGSAPLRAELAHWIGRSRGVDADPDQIVVTAGAQQAIDLITRLVIRAGDVVAVEDPGYRPVARLCRALGADVRPVAVDTEGLVVDAIPRRTRLVYTTPSHQFPTGAVLSLERRNALLDRAERDDVIIIEDDYDSEYRYVARPLEPLQRIDDGERVIYVGTFSKTLMPSLRLGFAVLPKPMVAAALELRALCDWQPAEPQQSALRQFIAEGHLGRHLRRTGKIYGERHELVAAFVRRGTVEGILQPSTPSCAGLHVTARLAAGIDEGLVQRRAAERGVALSVLGDSWLDGGAPGLVIGFGAIATDDLPAALTIVDEILRSAPARS